jgi:hypothetical protein
MTMTVTASPTETGSIRTAWQELMRRRRRRMLAQGFEAVLEDVRQPRGWYSARIPTERQQVLDAEWDIERLIGRLRGWRPIDDTGLRMARELLVDRGSPLFEPAEPGSLRRRVRVICEAVE